MTNNDTAHSATVNARWANEYYSADSYTATCPCGWRSERVYEPSVARHIAASHNDA